MYSFAVSCGHLWIIIYFLLQIVNILTTSIA